MARLTKGQLDRLRVVLAEIERAEKEYTTTASENKALDRAGTLLAQFIVTSGG